MPDTVPSPHDTASPDTLARRLLHGAGIGVVVAVLAILSWRVGAFESLEMLTLDARFRLVATHNMAPPPRDLGIITIDQHSLDSVNRLMSQRWPWPRAFYGRIIDFLVRAEARAIVFDILFTEPDISRIDISGDASDAALVDSTRRSGRTFHALVLKQSKVQAEPEEESILLERLRMFQVCADAPSVPLEYKGASLPSPDLLKACRGLGFVTLPDASDSTYRRSFPFVAVWGGQLVPSLPFAVAWDLTGQVRSDCRDGWLHFGQNSAPVDDRGQSWMWWYSSATQTNPPFPYYSAYGILRSSLQIERGEKPDYAPDEFRDKILYVGSTASGLFDAKATPLSPAVPGVELQVTMLANLLNGDSVTRLPWWVVALALLAICLLLGTLSRVFYHPLANGFLTLAVVAAALVAGTWLLAVRHEFLDLVPLILGSVATYVGATAVNYLNQRQQTRLVRDIFEHYLDHTVIRTLLAHPEKVRLGGERRNCTVLFSDVANFTQTSEKLPPEQVVRIMNLYLDAMTEIILAEGGFVDKFVGDEIVAIFGAPLDMPDHAVRACRAALRMQARVRELQPVFREAGCMVELFARTGLSTGEMVVGNMGSERRMNYTAMGDTMNLGARIEGTNKVYGTRIMTSGQTAREAAAAFLLRELDAVRVKGRASPESLFELVAETSQATDAQLAHATRYAEGLALYRAQKWEEALAVFRPLADAGDGPSVVLLTRCREYQGQPLPADWDGTYTMQTK